MGAGGIPRPTAAGRRLLASLVGRRADAHDLKRVVSGDPAVATVLAGIASYSPFLWRMVEQSPDLAAVLIASEPGAALKETLHELDTLAPDMDRAEVMRALRQARRRVALLVALADLSGHWTVDRVVDSLSAFADAAVRVAVRSALAEATAKGWLLATDPDRLDLASGYTVIALGKHGARELNYSSDVDLTIFYDAARAPLAPGVEPQVVFSAVTQSVVRLLQERTADGYVLRVDLRLRPDPASTPVAMPVGAAMIYYETVGQNWERAAMIKARPVAGDLDLGADVIEALQPFIWRKFFDYAAIADIHAMKRQIHSHKGHAVVAVEGHDVKLGRGGIREIEFFVQTQQLVFGGRRPHLRVAQTLEMLQRLRDDGWIAQTAVTELAAAYRYLRKVEHRLQMINDEQTQRLPADPAELSRFAAFMGATPARFRRTLLQHMTHVEAHYARLFEHAADLSHEGRNLVFTGAGYDQETLETVRRLGFKRPELAVETVRGWHFGRRPAVRSARAREALTELVPVLLEAFGKTTDGDAALMAFDEALERMPAAVELFALLKSREALRTLFANMLGSAPRLAEVVAQRPHVLDAVIDPAFVDLPDPDALRARVSDTISRATGTEEFLDTARNTARAEHILIGARILSGMIDAEASGPLYAAVADGIIAASLDRVDADLAQRHGRVPGARVAVVALGKLGSCEMNARSDLDLMVVYDHDVSTDISDGERPLHVSEWHSRLTQRLISALTVPTRRGHLYEIDMRLRPSGNKGPLAVSLRSFREYQFTLAEPWEHMSMTRARPVAGDADLQQALRLLLGEIVGQRRDGAKLGEEVRSMRALIADAKGDAGHWDLKLAPGGLVDIEFIVQFMQLAHAHRYPAVLQVGTEAGLLSLGRAHVLDDETARCLINAHRLQMRLAAMIALAADGVFNPDQHGASFKQHLAKANDLPDFRVLERHLMDTQREVRHVFEQVLGPALARVNERGSSI
jgi:glutamate-ammonia-ligase adenylyltransferase